MQKGEGNINVTVLGYYLSYHYLVIWYDLHKAINMYVLLINYDIFKKKYTRQW